MRWVWVIAWRKYKFPCETNNHDHNRTWKRARMCVRVKWWRMFAVHFVRQPRWPHMEKMANFSTRIQAEQTSVLAQKKRRNAEKFAFRLNVGAFQMNNLLEPECVVQSRQFNNKRHGLPNRFAILNCYVGSFVNLWDRPRSLHCLGQSLRRTEVSSVPLHASYGIAIIPGNSILLTPPPPQFSLDSSFNR